MATINQITANQANARKSTGPKTEEGKAASSRNALRHGLTSTRTLVGQEDAGEYQLLRDKLFQGYAPATPQEEVLVDRMVSATWRTLRSRQMEQSLSNMSIENFQAKRKHNHTRTSKTDTEALVISMVEDDLWRLMHRYDTQISRDFFRTANTLQKLQNDRRREERDSQKHAHAEVKAIREETRYARGEATHQVQQKTAAAGQNWVPSENQQPSAAQASAIPIDHRTRTENAA